MPRSSDSKTNAGSSHAGSSQGRSSQGSKSQAGDSQTGSSQASSSQAGSSPVANSHSGSRKNRAQKTLFRYIRGESPGVVDPELSDELLELFRRHRLIPYATDLLDHFDERSSAKWKDAMRRQSMRSLQFHAVLQELVRVFRESGSGVIPLKGPTLAYRLYGDVGKRQFVDLDLLVEETGIHRILETASKAGCRLVHPEPGLTDRQWEYYFRFRKDVGLVHEETGLSVELHIGLYYHTLLPKELTGFLWRETEALEIGMTTYRVMRPEESFLFLAYHGAFHQYMRLFWLKDVSDVLRTWNLDHERILENAKKLGIERMLGVSLVLAEEYFGTPIPEAYRTFLKENEHILTKLRSLCGKRIREPVRLNLPRKLSHQYYMLLLRSGARYKWSVLTGILHRKRIVRTLE